MTKAEKARTKAEKATHNLELLERGAGCGLGRDVAGDPLRRLHPPEGRTRPHAAGRRQGPRLRPAPRDPLVGARARNRCRPRLRSLWLPSPLRSERLPCRRATETESRHGSGRCQTFGLDAESGQVVRERHGWVVRAGNGRRRSQRGTLAHSSGPDAARPAAGGATLRPEPGDGPP